MNIDAITICGVVALTTVGLLEWLRVAAIRRQQEAIRRLATLTNAIGHAVFWVNADGFIRASNQAAAQSFGFRGGDLLGMNLAALLAPVDGTNVKDRIAACFRNATVDRSLPRVDAQATNADGARFPVSLSLHRGSDATNGECVALVADLSRQERDQRDLKSFADQLLVTKQALESQNAQLESTVAVRTWAHDLQIGVGVFLAADGELFPSGGVGIRPARNPERASWRFPPRPRYRPRPWPADVAGQVGLAGLAGQVGHHCGRLRDVHLWSDAGHFDRANLIGRGVSAFVHQRIETVQQLLEFLLIASQR